MKTLRHIFVEDDGTVVDFPYEIITPRETLIVFPEARPTVKKLCISAKKELNDIYKTQKEIKQEVYKKVKNMKNLELVQDLVVILRSDTARQVELEKKIADYDIMLQRVNGSTLEELKKIPITNYIEFRNGKAKCLWHVENTASLHYYEKQNVVFCFGGCGKKDVLDVVQELNHFKTVKETINFLREQNNI
jgi:hypothetical protein